MNDNTTTTDTITVLDLDAGVTPEQYAHVLDQLVTVQYPILSAHYNWCSGGINYLMNLSPHVGRGGHIEIPEDQTICREWVRDEHWDTYYGQFNATRAGELRALRGRILWYVNATQINLTEANAVLTALGLPPYEENNDGNPYSVYFNGSTRYRRNTTSPLPLNEYTQQVRDLEMAFLRDIGYAAQDQNEGRFCNVQTRQMSTVRQDEIVEILNRY